MPSDTISVEFLRAPMDATGARLSRGVLYFVDTTEDKFDTVLKDMLELFGEESLKDVIKDGRGNIMASFLPLKDIAVPKEILEKTGFFWMLKKDENLKDASMRLYGYISDELNFLDYIAYKFPGLVRGAVSAGETVIEVGKTIGNVGFYVIGGILLLGLGALALKLASKKRG